MLMYSTMKVEFRAIRPRSFQNENGEEIAYVELVGFEVDDNGNVTDNPVSFSVKKEAVSSFSGLSKGEIIQVRLEGYVKKARVSDIRRG